MFKHAILHRKLFDKNAATPRRKTLFFGLACVFKMDDDDSKDQIRFNAYVIQLRGVALLFVLQTVNICVLGYKRKMEIKYVPQTHTHWVHAMRWECRRFDAYYYISRRQFRLHTCSVVETGANQTEFYEIIIRWEMSYRMVGDGGGSAFSPTASKLIIFMDSVVWQPVR